MNRTAQNRFLMRRLGFIADPRTKPQIVPHDRAIYWRHQPSGALVVTFHKTRYTEAGIMRTALGYAIQHALTEAVEKVTRCLATTRQANEEASIAWWKEHGEP